MRSSVTTRRHLKQTIGNSTCRKLSTPPRNVSCALPSKRTVAVCSQFLSTRNYNSPRIQRSLKTSATKPLHFFSSHTTQPHKIPTYRHNELSSRFHPGQGYVAAISARKRRYPQRILILTDHHCSAVPPVPARQGAIQVPAAAAV